jgi:hypothetical protein
MSRRSYNHGRRRNTITEQFAWRTIRMLESPAYRVLSYTALRILARIEIELGHHGGERGRDNGKLIVTYDQFVAYGIHRHAIAPALRELVTLGFIKITQQGRAGNADFRRPTMFRLTYRHAGGAQPTNEWERIETIEEAEMIAKAARRPGRNSAWAPPTQKQNPSAGKRQVSVTETITENPKIHGTETITTCDGTETITTFDISGRRAGVAAELSTKTAKATGAATEPDEPMLPPPVTIEPVKAVTVVTSIIVQPAIDDLDIPEFLKRTPVKQVAS